MDVPRVRLRLGFGYFGMVAGVLATVNVALMATTTAFIELWETREQHGALAQALIEHLLVQFHLATENVLAAWYSSMLLLAVGALALVAFVSDRRLAAETGRASGLAYGWVLFGAAFVVLSLDEIGSFHERFGMLALGGGQSQGWVYVLALPIGLVALFMAAFAWLHVRRAPRALVLMALGIALFVADPVFEQIEMTIIHGPAAPGTWPRFVHDALLVIEEGVAELFGVLCFLSAIVVYLRRTAREIDITLTRRAARAAIAALALVFAAGVPVTHAMVMRLPPGDTGIPEHWFPAAALALAAGWNWASRAPDARRFAIAALAVSAWFGAGLHAYPTWHRFDTLRLLVDGMLSGGFAYSVAAAGGVSARTLAGAILVAIAVIAPASWSPIVAVVGAALCLRLEQP